MVLATVAILVGLIAAAYGARSSGLTSVSPYSSARAVADALGCTHYVSGLPAPALGVSISGMEPPPQFGTCTFDGHRTVVGWSTTGEVTYAFFSMIPGSDAPGHLLHSVGWSVRCASSADCRDAEARLGGVLG
jgi:hypothetical protein